MVVTMVTIRKATENDIPELVRQRRLMFEAMGFKDSQKLDMMEEASRKFFIENMACNRFHGWVAVTRTDEIVCNIGIIIDKHPPGPTNLTGKIAYIFNLFTLSEFRRQGIARKIMQNILEWIKKAEIIIVTLYDSEEGENLYKSLGFTLSEEMYLNTEKMKEKVSLQ